MLLDVDPWCPSRRRAGSFCRSARRAWTSQPSSLQILRGKGRPRPRASRQFGDEAADLRKAAGPTLVPDRFAAVDLRAGILECGLDLVDECVRIPADPASSERLDLRDLRGDDGKAGGKVFASLQRIGTERDLADR